ncbi:ubiquinol-cytochrome C chaperone family protein [Aureimonas jatrophae]|uniref:Cytochrome b pre-mRNA-processing protein 3 n=1 Tax=Aureimonas jatrophae TaxID=1166073 RepID=A0A1H0GTL1_9HYPH|nr:ubiquinol-cytochrome C chaperone family protein [Aureimonas jatrophae]MBB3949770.1 cytochrome b pre-mRNA-processing protein 3 [Aureimonas jatrophae]SDO10132.1 cytochrome b pre-mRNA-processing protein 3 [Aureimonas jatrophae]
MLEAFRRRRRNREVVERLWDDIVLRARQPERFEQGGLPDTVLGRFESLGLETFLFLRRCSNDPRLTELSQDVVDRFMTDLDHSMRELGVGYLAVPKRMRKLAGRFYARVQALEAPLALRDRNALAHALCDTVFRDAEGGDPSKAPQLADQLVAGSDWFDRLPVDSILTGQISPSTKGFGR